jgi:Protein of unknown function (DUF4231)
MASQPIALRLPGAAPMRRLFAGPPPQSRAGETPLQALDTAIESWTCKALWNKKAARRGTRAIVLSSAAIPVVLLVSVNVHGIQVGQVLASFLAAMSTAAAAFLQFNRPYADWALYREFQRWAERERFAFDNGLKPYDSDDDLLNEKTLAVNLFEAKQQLENRRAALIPKDGDVTSSARGR